MQDYAAVFRTGDVLKEGCVKMDEGYPEMADLLVFQRLFDLHSQLLEREWFGQKRDIFTHMVFQFVFRIPGNKYDS